MNILITLHAINSSIVTGGGVDYYFGPYNVMIPARVTSVSFNISIIDDNVLEGNENFVLTINPSSLPNDVNVGNPHQAVVIIVDNDGE